MSGKIIRIITLLAVFTALPLLIPSSAGADSARVQKSLLAGTWYPGSETDLRAAVDKFLLGVPSPGMPERPVALISPHAGYMYSGQVAGYSYATLRGHKFDTVIVMGPSHQVAFSGVATFDCAGFSTPMGEVPIDRDLVKALMKREPKIRDFPEAFAREHSVEIQLPFLQTVLPGFKLVPIVMGDADIATCRWLADAISDCTRGKSVLVVASSDLSHFHSYETAREMDQRLLEFVKAMDVDQLYGSLEKGTSEACGRGPIITAMLVSRKCGANACRVLEYANSGDVTGDKKSARGVVGYASAVFFETARDRDKPEKAKAGIDLGLSKEDKAELHAIARNVIEAVCRGKQAPARKTSELSPRLKELSGAFVTIYKKGELRGCIGQVTARQPLADAVAESAESAAIRDPRFTPLRPEELPDITIEISALTPFKKIESPDEIEVGKHGLIIRRGMAAGLLLPQVATEYQWGRTEFLEHTCLKAGLPRDAWKDKGTEIFVFSADVF